MQLFVTIVHVLLCIALVFVILLQPAKDGSALLGGGVNSMYGPRANAHPLGRATSVIAALFMVTSVYLAYKSTQQRADDDELQQELERLEQEKAANAPAPAPEPTPAEALPPVDAAAPTDAPADDAAAPAPADAPVAPAAPTGSAP